MTIEDVIDDITLVPLPEFNVVFHYTYSLLNDYNIYTINDIEYNFNITYIGKVNNMLVFTSNNGGEAYYLEFLDITSIQVTIILIDMNIEYNIKIKVFKSYIEYIMTDIMSDVESIINLNKKILNKQNISDELFQSLIDIGYNIFGSIGLLSEFESLSKDYLKQYLYTLVKDIATKLDSTHYSTMVVTPVYWLADDIVLVI